MTIDVPIAMAVPRAIDVPMPIAVSIPVAVDPIRLYNRWLPNVRVHDVVSLYNDWRPVHHDGGRRNDHRQPHPD